MHYYTIMYGLCILTTYNLFDRFLQYRICSNKGHWDFNLTPYSGQKLIGVVFEPCVPQWPALPPFSDRFLRDRIYFLDRQNRGLKSLISYLGQTRRGLFVDAKQPLPTPAKITRQGWIWQERTFLYSAMSNRRTCIFLLKISWGTVTFFQFVKRYFQPHLLSDRYTHIIFIIVSKHNSIGVRKTRKSPGLYDRATIKFKSVHELKIFLFLIIFANKYSFRNNSCTDENINMRFCRQI